MLNEEKLSLWIFGSVGKHFDAIAKANNIHMFMEGQKRDTRDLPAFFELRVDGPNIIDRGTVLQLKFTIIITVQVTLDGDDYFKCQRINGYLGNAFWSLLPIYQTDSEGTADDEYAMPIIGCANLIPDHRGRDVRIFQFGQVDPVTLIQRANIEGQYKLTLTREN